MFALPALEASAFVGFIAPGEIGVILGGVLANQHKLSLWAVLVAGITGAVIGDSVGYEVGKRYGERILTKIRTGSSSRSIWTGPRSRFAETAARRCSSAGSPPPCGSWCRASRG